MGRRAHTWIASKVFGGRTVLSEVKYLVGIVPCLLVASPAAAEEIRVHVEAGAAHAVGTPQGRELGAGGGGDARVELPVARMLGVQAGVGAVILSEGSAPSDPGIAQRSTGMAVFGTAGVRLHPFGEGLWLDGNAGVAETGGLFRPVLDAHVGWDFRASSLVSVGPFVGYTQIIQGEDALRPNDARILVAGLGVTFGRAEKRPAPPPAVEPTPAPKPDTDGLAFAVDHCPGGLVETESGCAAPIALVDDRLEIGDVIHFDFDSPVIREESEELVDRVARFIVKHPEIDEIEIEGHADARGSAAYNQRLSEARAAATRAMLVRFGVEETRLRAVGFGKSRLKVRTTRAEPENRRVEFLVVRRDRGLTSAVNGESR